MPATFVIQARTGSARFPGKVVADICGSAMLAWVVRAARQAAGAGDSVIVATTDKRDDRPIDEIARAEGADVSYGPEDDVLTRFIIATAGSEPDAPIVRLTGDCPLTDPALLRWGIASFRSGGFDYIGTPVSRTLPQGIEIEVFSRAALELADANAASFDRIHVTSWMYSNPDRLRVGGLVVAPPADDLRVTVDTEEDLEAVRAIVTTLGDRASSWRDVVGLLRDRPEIAQMNAHVSQKSLSEG